MGICIPTSPPFSSSNTPPPSFPLPSSPSPFTLSFLKQLFLHCSSLSFSFPFSCPFLSSSSLINDNLYISFSLLFKFSSLSSPSITQLFPSSSSESVITKLSPNLSFNDKCLPLVYKLPPTSGIIGLFALLRNINGVLQLLLFLLKILLGEKL